MNEPSPENRGFILPYAIVVLAVIAAISTAAIITLQTVRARELALLDRTEFMYASNSSRTVTLYNEIALSPDRQAASFYTEVVCVKRDEASFIRPWRLDLAAAARVSGGEQVDPRIVADSYRAYQRAMSDDTEADAGSESGRNIFDLRFLPGWRSLDQLWEDGLALTEFSVHGPASFNVVDASDYALGIEFGLDQAAAQALSTRSSAGMIRNDADLSLFVLAPDQVGASLAPRYIYRDSATFSLITASTELLFGSRHVYEIEPYGLTAPFSLIDEMTLDAASLGRLSRQVENGRTIPEPWRCDR